jgi:hypothetical protein
MNERIKELVEKSGIYFGNFESVTVDLDQIEKFAQLIVKECVAIANRQFSAATGLDDRDCLTAHQMKQHFGVEE